MGRLRIAIALLASLLFAPLTFAGAQANSFNNTNYIYITGDCTGSGATYVPTNCVPDLSKATAVLAPAHGGTGVANGANNTITFTGNFTLGLTLSGNTALTLPTSGTLATLGSPTFTGTVTLPDASTFTSSGSTFAAAAQFNANIGIATTDTLALFNTADQVTNYERFRLFWSGNVAKFAVEAGGTGTNRSLEIYAAGTGPDIFLAAGNGSTSGTMRFGSGSTFSVAGSVGVLDTGTYNAATLVAVMHSIAPTISQSGTAGYDALLIDPTESATGSGVKNLLHMKTGTTEEFSVLDNAATAIGNPTGGNEGAGTLNVAGLYYANGTAGVSCSANTVTLLTEVVSNGIVTHC